MAPAGAEMGCRRAVFGLEIAVHGVLRLFAEIVASGFVAGGKGDELGGVDDDGHFGYSCSGLRSWVLH